MMPMKNMRILRREIEEEEAVAVEKSAKISEKDKNDVLKKWVCLQRAISRLIVTIKVSVSVSTVFFFLALRFM